MVANPAVSVVVPAHQAASTLRTALESLLAQRPEPAEVIVVDDGSTDATAEIARGFSGVRVISQANAGPSAARNAGIAEASGPWVAFCDADDAWLPGKLAAQLQVAQSRPEVSLIAGDWVRSGSAAPAEVAHNVGLSVFDYRDVLVLNRFQTSTVLARKSLLEQAGGFVPALDGAEDWDMWLRCARLGELIKIDAPLVVYRDEATGYSKDLHRLYRAMCAMLDREQQSLFPEGGSEGGSGGGAPPLSRAQFRRLRAWHYLRFAVGFQLAGDRRGAVWALRDLARSPVAVSAPSAAVVYLLPFLARRVSSRRVRGKAG
jgi:glycosyltransferase involved in cell wall biosynthesis